METIPCNHVMTPSRMGWKLCPQRSTRRLCWTTTHPWPNQVGLKIASFPHITGMFQARCPGVLLLFGRDFRREEDSRTGLDGGRRNFTQQAALSRTTQEAVLCAGSPNRAWFLAFNLCNRSIFHRSTRSCPGRPGPSVARVPPLFA